MVPEKRSHCLGMTNLWSELKKRVIDGKEAVQRQEPGDLCKGGMGPNPSRDRRNPVSKYKNRLEAVMKNRGFAIEY